MYTLSKFKTLFYSQKRNKYIYEWKRKNCSPIIWINWILDLAFLTDITTFLNELNVKLQRKEKLLPDNMYSDIKSFSVWLKLFFYKHIDEKN